MDPPQILPEFILDFLWTIQGLFMDCLWIISSLSQEYPWNILWLSLEYPKITPGSAQDIL